MDAGQTVGLEQHPIFAAIARAMRDERPLKGH